MRDNKEIIELRELFKRLKKFTKLSKEQDAMLTILRWVIDDGE